MIIKFKKLHEKAKVPEYKTASAAGADLSVASFGSKYEWTTKRIYPGQIAMVHTGLALQIPHGYEGQIRPRSGLGSKGLTVVNTPGTIDSDFLGEVRVALINLGNDYVDINVGDRVAQLIISPVVRFPFVEVELEPTERGENGFGSTGI